MNELAEAARVASVQQKKRDPRLVLPADKVLQRAKAKQTASSHILKHLEQDDSSVASSLRNNTVALSSKAVRASFARRRLGTPFFLVAGFFAMFAFLLFGKIVFMNIVATRYDRQLEMSRKTIFSLYQIDSRLKDTLAALNQLNHFLVEQARGDHKLQDAVRAALGRFDYQEYLSLSVELGAARGLRTFEELEVEMLFQGKWFNRESIDLITKAATLFDWSARTGVDQKSALGAESARVSQSYRAPLQSYLPHLFLKIRALSARIKAVSAKSQAVAEADFQQVKYQIHVLNYEALERALPDYLRKASYVVEYMVVEENNAYQTTFVVFLTFCIVLACLNSIGLHFALICLDRRFGEIVSCYKFLKPQEIELQSLIIQDQLSLCSEFKFHESSLIESYTSVNHKWQNMKAALTSEVAKQDNNRNKRFFHISNKKYLPSVKLAFSFNLVAIVVFTGLCLLVFLLKNGYQRAARFLQFYERSSALISKANYNGLGFIVFQVLGRAHRLDQDDLDYFISSPGELVSNWERSREDMKPLISSADLEEYTSVLKSSLCGLIRPTDQQSEEKLALCAAVDLAKDSKTASQVLYVLQETISAAFSAAAAKEQAFLGQTAQPGLDLSFKQTSEAAASPESVQARVFLECLLPTLSNRLDDFYRKQISQLLSRVSDTLYLLRAYALVFAVLAYTVLALLGIAELGGELVRCLETFRVIFPDIILNNPYLLNSFRTYFRFSIS